MVVFADGGLNLHRAGIPGVGVVGGGVGAYGDGQQPLAADGVLCVVFFCGFHASGLLC